jgi:hypothetical protein
MAYKILHIPKPILSLALLGHLPPLFLSSSHDALAPTVSSVQYTMTSQSQQLCWSRLKHQLLKGSLTTPTGVTSPINLTQSDSIFFFHLLAKKGKFLKSKSLVYLVYSFIPRN